MLDTRIDLSRYADSSRKTDKHAHTETGRQLIDDTCDRSRLTYRLVNGQTHTWSNYID